ncbi:amidase [Roseovarius indicus]|uniref:amidase n=1 Tax=Roseovarius indicus TaxID=540747 RepID=UPI0032EB797B
MLTSEEYRRQDATGLAALVRSGEVSAAELLDVALAEIDRLDPSLNAVVARNDAAAREAAETVDKAAPFAGVPFLAKDINVDVAGFRTTHACRFFAEAPVATEDSALVRRWRAAGLVIPGRTNTPEFATDYVCEPELFGPTRNPWDLTRTPGGSSGGAAAAVAAGMVPMAHASDSGGSIRVPAACCGLFGFKPSGGVIASGSPMGPLVGGINVDHVVSRSVRDSAGMLAATAAPEAGQPVPWRAVPDDLVASLSQAPEGLRVGVVLSSPAGHEPDRATREAVAKARALLEELGHKTDEFHWPDDVDPFDCSLPFWASEIAAVIDARTAALGRPATEDELGPLIHWSVDQARRLSSVDMVQARMRMTAIRRKIASAMDDLDVLLLPALTEPPLPTGLLSELIERDADGWAERSFRFAPYTEIFNVTGQPAMSVPLYQFPTGLPLAVQMVGHVGQDAVMLRLARQLEEAAPWSDRRPPEFP